MKKFMDEDFLLGGEVARELFSEARDMPIIDYHCHLNVREIAEDARFQDVGYLMLGGDHYKWRAMRSYGIDERLITGDADYYDKFMAYAKMLPNAIGNPLYHWTHLELKRVFDIDEPLNEKSAPAIWNAANEMLKRPEFSAKGLIKKFKVSVVCTTDDPVDSLEYHEAARENCAAFVTASFRPDKAINAERPGFAKYISKLSEVSGVDIRSTRDVIEALICRMDYFAARGVKISDHGLDTVPEASFDWAKADKALVAGLKGERVNKEALDSYRALILVELGKAYHDRGWAQQYHIGALRNNNSRMLKLLGPDTGFDSTDDTPFAANLSKIMNAQDMEGRLPKTVLYTLNPTGNAVLATMAGNFQSSEARGKIQFGSGWWFCDTRPGMEAQLTSLANLSLLSGFVGMLTDSRSFVSYPRHEYFRRILCNLVGGWVEAGEYPRDMEFLKGMIKDICYYNAKAYFGF